MNEFRCYVDGKPVGRRFYVVGWRRDGDRAFIVSERNIKRIEDTGIKVLVRETAINCKRKRSKR